MGILVDHFNKSTSIETRVDTIAANIFCLNWSTSEISNEESDFNYALVDNLVELTRRVEKNHDHISIDSDSVVSNISGITTVEGNEHSNADLRNQLESNVHIAIEPVRSSLQTLHLQAVEEALVQRSERLMLAAQKKQHEEEEQLRKKALSDAKKADTERRKREAKAAAAEAAAELEKEKRRLADLKNEAARKKMKQDKPPLYPSRGSRGNGRGGRG